MPLSSWKGLFDRIWLAFYKVSIILALLILPIGHLYADQRAYLFQKGNEYYQAGDYEKAIQAYEEILRMGYESPEVYFNLGNAYFKLRQTGKAILNYERARRLAPRDEDILFNLRIANLAVVDKIPAIPEFFFTKIFDDFKALFPINSLCWGVVFLYVLAVLCVILRILLRPPKARRSLTYGAAFLGALLLILSITLYSKVHDLRYRVEAVIMVPKVDVRSAPSEDGIEVFSLHEGTKVQVVEERGEWLEIRLPDGKMGWLKRESLEII